MSDNISMPSAKDTLMYSRQSANDAAKKSIESRERELKAVLDLSTSTEQSATRVIVSVWEDSPLVQIHGSLPPVSRIEDIIKFAPWLLTQLEQIIPKTDYKEEATVIILQDVLFIGHFAATIVSNLSPSLFQYRQCRTFVDRIIETIPGGDVYAEGHFLHLFDHLLTAAARKAKSDLGQMIYHLQDELEKEIESEKSEVQRLTEAIFKPLARPAGSIGFSLSGANVGDIRPHLETLAKLLRVLAKESDQS